MPGKGGERGTLLQAERLAKGGNLKKGKTEKGKTVKKGKKVAKNNKWVRCHTFVPDVTLSCQLPGPPYLRLNKWRSRVWRIQSLPGVILLKQIAIYLASTKSCSR